jgi:hypothetical protein
MLATTRYLLLRQQTYNSGYHRRRTFREMGSDQNLDTFSGAAAKQSQTALQKMRKGREDGSEKSSM